MVDVESSGNTWKELGIHLYASRQPDSPKETETHTHTHSHSNLAVLECWLYNPNINTITISDYDLTYKLTTASVRVFTFFFFFYISAALSFLSYYKSLLGLLVKAILQPKTALGIGITSDVERQPGHVRRLDVSRLSFFSFAFANEGRLLPPVILQEQKWYRDTFLQYNVCVGFC